MRWKGNRQSDNVEDVRESGESYGGGGMRLPLGGRSLGVGSIVLAVVVGYFLDVNPLTVLGVLSGGESPAVSGGAPAPGPISNDEQTQFIRTVLADTEDVWRDLFRRSGAQYVDPKLRIFRGSTPTACGRGESAMGPFYCPNDQKVYIDLAFYETLRKKLGAPGDFAQAYVIAHEVGHHVQHLQGTLERVHRARGSVGQARYNELSVRLELQADCYAGLWANHAQRSRQVIEAGDVEEALNAASQIGDDTIQRKTQGHVVPETFTHGTSQQRVTWFRRGLESGEMKQCNSFD